MKKRTEKATEPEMLEEYDFSSGVRGKYVDRFSGVRNDVVVLAPDVAEVFDDSESVNDALRSIVRIIAKQKRKRAA